jgi:CspA family cold shock protein
MLIGNRNPPEPTTQLLIPSKIRDVLSCPKSTPQEADIALSALSVRVRKPIVKRQQRRLEMARGTVKWFNSQKGYGFIQPEGGGGKDVFVHISAVEKAGLSSLNDGQVVEYEEVADKGKTSAQNLKVQR